MARNRRGRPRHPDVLTPAEWRVLEELREGGTSAEIASRLGISGDAVKYHISNMLGKLELRDRHALAAWRPERRRLRGLVAIPAGFEWLSRSAPSMGAALATAALAILVAFAVAATVLLNDAEQVPPAAVPAPVIVELRVWQGVDDPENLLVSARLRGESLDALSMVPFGDLERNGRSFGFADTPRHRYGDVVIAGVALRVWQRETEPGSVFVQACSSTTCRASRPSGPIHWRPLGMNRLPLADGHSPDGSYRYGDIAVAIPRDNTQLLLDREHLLALRDVLEGGATELDWDVGTTTAEWEGVTVSGSPPRVTGLDLSNRGLAGEIWGYVGDLAKLRELRLDGNALTGLLPSKMSLLTTLSALYVRGNDLAGCIPPPLRGTANHDLDSLALPDCAEPGLQFGQAGTYKVFLARTATRGETLWVIFDIPPDKRADFFHFVPAVISSPAGTVFTSGWTGAVLRSLDFGDSWLFIDATRRQEVERSPYAGCIYDCTSGRSAAATIEQIAVSFWIHSSVSLDREAPAPVWP